MSKVFQNDIKPWIIAHRGSRSEAPENTYAAFDKALTYQIEGLELDVQLTRDGVPVLYHDRTLYKISGRRKRIADFTYEQLLAYDWGAWYSPIFSGESILTLHETLLRYVHRTRLMIEIKSREIDRKSGKSTELLDKVLGGLANPEIRNYLDNIFILSFDADLLKSASQKAPNIKYVLTLPDSKEGQIKINSMIQQFLIKTDHLHAVCVNIKYLSKELVAYAHDSGKKVMTFTCNRSDQLNKALSLNTDVILTDKPGWLAGQMKW